MERMRHYFQAALVLLALYGGLALVTGRARAQQADCLNVALCSDRRTPFRQHVVVDRQLVPGTDGMFVAIPIHTTVPLARRAVIESASVTVNSPTTTARIQAARLVHSAGGLAAGAFPIIPVLQTRRNTLPPSSSFSAYAPVLLSVRSQDRLQVAVDHDKPAAPIRVFVSVTLTGYLVDQ